MIWTLFTLSNVPLSLCEIQIRGYYHIVKNLLAYIMSISNSNQLFLTLEKNAYF